MSTQEDKGHHLVSDRKAASSKMCPLISQICRFIWSWHCCSGPTDRFYACSLQPWDTRALRIEGSVSFMCPHCLLLRWVDLQRNSYCRSCGKAHGG